MVAPFRRAATIVPLRIERGLVFASHDDHIIVIDHGSGHAVSPALVARSVAIARVETDARVWVSRKALDAAPPGRGTSLGDYVPRSPLPVESRRWVVEF